MSPDDAGGRGRGGRGFRGRGGGGKGGGGGRGSHRHHGSGPSPALLTAQIKKATTVGELLETTSKHEKRLNHIHLSACWNSLGRLSWNAEKDWHHQHSDALTSLAMHTRHVVASSSEIGGRELANIAHGVAKARGGGLPELMEALARALEGRLDTCKPQELSNVSWAFAKAGHHHCADAPLWTAIARAAERHPESFNAQEMANTLWSFATAGHSQDPGFLKAMAKGVEGNLDHFTGQGLSNTCWALMKLNHLDAQLFKRMAGAVKRRLGTYNSHDVATTAFAFASAGMFDDDLFKSLAECAKRNLDKMDAQGLANTTYAFAKAGYVDAKLFSALEKPISRRLQEFQPRDIASVSWSLAKACHVNEDLFASLSIAAQLCLRDFSLQDLVNISWAMAKVGQFDEAFFSELGAAITALPLDDLSAQGLANVAWSFAKTGRLDERLFRALGETALQRVQDLSAADLSTLAWSFVNAGHVEPGLFAALARAAERLLGDFGEEDLDNAEWAFKQAGEERAVKLLRQRKRRAAAAEGGEEDGGATKGTKQQKKQKQKQVDVSGVGRIVVAGGGIGGAAAAVALQNRGFDVVVLESDPSFDARKQGYGLTIQGYGATVQAMGVNLAQDDAPSTSHYTFDAEGHVIGFFGEAFGSKTKERREAENSGRFIHIPRQVLRSRLVERVLPGTIRWSSRLRGFEPKEGPEGGVRVTLQDGAELDAALLVGSDGIFSTVRRQLALPGDRLNFVGFLVALGIVSEEAGGGSVPLAKRRIFETVDGTTRIYAMPFTTTSTMWQLSFPYSEEAGRALSKDPAALKDELLRRCSGWHEPIPELLRNTPLDCMAGYPVYDRDLLEPEALRPPSSSPGRVTLIGDAAHPMTPFRAQGANQALSDAVLLADCLAEGVRDHGPAKGLDAALPVFERKMLSRSSRAVIASREKAKELHSPLALQPARKAQREAGLDMRRVVKALRSRGIGARDASDPRGLDAVVSEAIESFRSEEGGGVQQQGGGGRKRARGLVPSETATGEGTGNQAAPKAETASDAAPATAARKKAKKGGTNKDASIKDDITHTADAGAAYKKAAAAVAKEAGAAASGQGASSARTGKKLWGLTSNGWCKCVLVEVTKTGKYRVEMPEDGVRVVLPPGYVRLRGKQQQKEATAAASSPAAPKSTKQSLIGGPDGASKGRRLWGFKEGAWHKCVWVANKKSGKLKVEWMDGTTALLPPDYIQPRGGKKK